MLHYIYTPLMREEHNLPDYDGNYYFLLNKEDLTEINTPIHSVYCDHFWHKMYQEHCICGALDVLVRLWRETHKNKTEFHYHQRRQLRPTRQIPPDPTQSIPQHRTEFSGAVQPRESAFVAEMAEQAGVHIESLNADFVDLENVLFNEYDGPDNEVEVPEHPTSHESALEQLVGMNERLGIQPPEIDPDEV